MHWPSKFGALLCLDWSTRVICVRAPQTNIGKSARKTYLWPTFLLDQQQNFIQQQWAIPLFPLPVVNFELRRVESMRRGGRRGVGVFAPLLLFRSNALLILERGAKIPKKKKNKIKCSVKRHVDRFGQTPAVYLGVAGFTDRISFDRWNTEHRRLSRHSSPLVYPAPPRPRGPRRTRCCRRTAGFQPARTENVTGAKSDHGVSALIKHERLANQSVK